MGMIFKDIMMSVLSGLFVYLGLKEIGVGPAAGFFGMAVMCLGFIWIQFDN